MGFRPHIVSQSIYDSFKLVNLPQYALAVGFLNLGDQKFRQLGWKLLALFPEIDADAFEGSADELVYRRMELFHTSISVVVDGFQKLADRDVMVSVDGRDVPWRILLAAIVGDFPQQAQHAISKGGCLYCKCGKDDRADVDAVFEPITVEEQRRGVHAACAKHFDADGKPLQRHGEAIEKAEKELGTVLFENAWWKVLEYILAVYKRYEG